MKQIAEIYPCIQGEGKHAGMPSILIRTLGCNLRCVWCDTPYASWAVEKGTYGTQDILPFIKENPLINEIIITGGEPCLYPELKELVGICKAHNKHITLETNGTLFPPDEISSLIDLVSISPKLSNSLPETGHWRETQEKERINIPSIQQWISTAADYQLKFVVSNPEDLKEIKTLVTLTQVDRQKVFLMPLGVNEEELQPKRIWLADLCIKEGFRYCERIHIVVYGNKRGV